MFKFRYPYFTEHQEWMFLAGVILGIFLIPHYVLAIFGGFVAVVLWRKQSWIFVAALLVGLLANTLNNIPTNYGKILKGTSSGGEAVVQLNDSALSSLEMLPYPYLLKANLHSIKLIGEEQEQCSSGKIFIKLPYDFKQKIHYNEEWRVSGIFKVVDSSDSFSNYLKTQKVDAILYANSMDFVKKTPSVMGYLLSIRDCIAEKIISNIRNDETKRAAIALILGCRNGLNYDAKQDYIRAGTIHIFVVSGFHIGIIALMLLWILCPLSFRWRYLLLPLILLVFVVITGANTPALRAWTMISVWSICRLYLLRTSTIKIVVILASIFIIINPPLVMDMGFLYSFIITGMLLFWSSNPISKLDATDTVFIHPKPKYRLWLNTIKRKIKLVFWGCTVAFLASCTIALSYQGLWLPWSILANIIVLPFACSIFYITAFKLALGWIPFCDILFARLLEIVFAILNGLSVFVADYLATSSVRTPSPYEIGLFYLALLLLLIPSKKIFLRIIGAAGVVMLILFWQIYPLFNSNSALLICYNGGVKEPAIVIADTQAKIGLVVNVPNREVVPKITEFLRSRGIQKVDRVLFSSQKSANIGGLSSLKYNIPINVVEIKSPTGAFKNRLSEVEKRYPELKISTNMASFIKVSENRVEYFNKSTKLRCEIFWEYTPSGELILNLSPLDKKIFEPCNVMEFVEYEL